MTTLTFTAIRAVQSDEHFVMCFTATAAEIWSFATIERIARDGEGHLSGFQRPQIASHIQEIKDYLKREDAVLPNPIVVAFTDNVTVKHVSDDVVQVTINTQNGPPGLVVDGQQWLTVRTQFAARKALQSICLGATVQDGRRIAQAICPDK